MSYRAFKRLLGETSLERKCRFLFGTATLLLITASFYWYARQTEDLAYNQVAITGQLIVWPILRDHHEKILSAPAKAIGQTNQAGKARPSDTDQQLHQAVRDWDLVQQALKEAQENTLPKEYKKYSYWIIRPNSRSPASQPSDSFETKLLQEFRDDEQKNQASRRVQNPPSIQYYGAIRADSKCLSCHPRPGEPNLKNQDFMAMVKIQLPAGEVEAGIHQNRAMLIATALVTAILIMTGSYLIVRYIIVNPVMHLRSEERRVGE